ncbi:MAG: nucleotide exchange factor GrpE [Candidatus Izimaplasma sp.]|nr:nucleotide exchange factor GrpE [Candidatus Izimaplasma bacterium]
MEEKTKKEQEEKETQATTEQDNKVEETEETKELTKEEQLSQEIDELKEVVKDLKADFLKEHAKLENTKKRLVNERIKERKYAAMGIAKNLLEPIDNFELALKHNVDNDAVHSYVQGFKIIKNQLMKALEDEGVSEIAALDEEYNPKFHHAVGKEKVDGLEKDIVIEVLQTGYMFKDRVLRPAMVKISE